MIWSGFPDFWRRRHDQAPPTASRSLADPRNDLWGSDYLDMLGPAHIVFQADGRGEFAFGCVNATMDCDYAGRSVFFTWTGFDENDEVSGEGSAELNDGE